MSKIIFKKAFRFKYDGTFFCFIAYSGVLSILVSLFLLYLYKGCKSIFTIRVFNINPLQSDPSIFYVALTIASISILVGYTSFIALYFHRGHKIAHLNPLNRIKILNDISFLFPSFFHWFIKLSFSFFIALILSDYPKLFEDFWMILPLLFMVLFLDISKTMIRKMNSLYRLKFIVATFLLLFLCSALMACTISPSIKKNNNLLERTANFVDLPELNTASITDYIGKSNFYRSSIRIKYNYSPHQSNYVLDGEALSLNKLATTLKKYYSGNEYRFDITLYAEKNFSMQEKFDFEQMLLDNQFERVNYVFKTPKNEFDYIPYDVLSSNLWKPINSSKFYNQHITLNVNNYSLANKEKKLQRDKIFEDGINNRNHFIFQIDSSSNYKNYLDFIVTYKNLVMTKRNEAADFINPNCGESYRYIDSKNCQDLFEMLRNKFPLNYHVEFIEKL